LQGRITTEGQAPDEFLKSEQVHDTSCLITNLDMPGLNGIELQDWLIAHGHCIPIIFITANPDENDLIRQAFARVLHPASSH
jgi:FixJ family two-component response regulator